LQLNFAVAGVTHCSAPSADEDTGIISVTCLLLKAVTLPVMEMSVKSLVDKMKVLKFMSQMNCFN
jgi:hypothetical protein